MKKYNIIYADPTWNYRDKSVAGKRGIDFKYKTVSPLEQICKLPVKDIAADNSVLFLWTTFPTIFEQSEKVMNAWGFKYKTLGFVWIKKNKVSINTNFWGGGHYTRSNPEVCLIATKGNLPKISRSVHSVIEAPVGKHSEKPDEARDRIIQLYGNMPRIELYSRKSVDGWDSWGDECEKSIDIQTYAEYNKVYNYLVTLGIKIEIKLNKPKIKNKDELEVIGHNLYQYTLNLKSSSSIAIDSLLFYADCVNKKYNLGVKEVIK